MSVRKTIMAAAMVFIIAGAVPAKASADWLFTPFVGFNFNGSANTTETGQTFNDEFKRKADFGASLAWMGAGIFGVEFDFGYSPNFFKETTGDVNLGFSDSNVTTFMGNIVVGAPIGGTSGMGSRLQAPGPGAQSPTRLPSPRRSPASRAAGRGAAGGARARGRRGSSPSRR